MDTDLTELAAFLNEANKHTYANGAAAKVESLRPKSEDYHFEKGDWVYHDTYFGARDFTGAEVVYKAGVPVWGMNYYGAVLKSEAELSTKDAYCILRPALMQEYDDIIPVRGPREYREGDSLYRNRVEGDLAQFVGVEEILINDEVVCRTHYHGGLIR